MIFVQFSVLVFAFEALQQCRTREIRAWVSAAAYKEVLHEIDMLILIFFFDFWTLVEQQHSNKTQVISFRKCNKSKNSMSGETQRRLTDWKCIFGAMNMTSVVKSHNSTPAVARYRVAESLTKICKNKRKCSVRVDPLNPTGNAKPWIQFV